MPIARKMLLFYLRLIQVQGIYITGVPKISNNNIVFIMHRQKRCENKNSFSHDTKRIQATKYNLNK